MWDGTAVVAMLRASNGRKLQETGHPVYHVTSQTALPAVAFSRLLSSNAAYEKVVRFLESARAQVRKGSMKQFDLSIPVGCHHRP